MFDSNPIRLIIVDEQPSIRHLCAAIGGRTGLSCVHADSFAAALNEMAKEEAELMLADLNLGGGLGLQLLEEVKRRWPLAEVTLMGSYGNAESAAQAARLGAYDFVAKPFRVEEMQRVLERMAEKARLVRENELLRIRLLGESRAVSPLPVSCTDLEELERLTIQQVFERVGGDKEQAQKLLGISRATLYRKIKRYGIVTRPLRKKVAAAEHGDADPKRAAGASKS
jgi:DNA-binding NtrC family response regulator